MNTADGNLDLFQPITAFDFKKTGPLKGNLKVNISIPPPKRTENTSTPSVVKLEISKAYKLDSKPFENKILAHLDPTMFREGDEYGVIPISKPVNYFLSSKLQKLQK